MSNIQHTYKPNELLWIHENLNSRVYKNYRDFTDEFNKKFRNNVSVNSITQILHRKQWKISTEHNTRYSEPMKKWIRENFKEYETFSEMVKDFNSTFGTCKHQSDLNNYCKRAGIYVSSTDRKPYRYEKGHSAYNECPIGTLRKTDNGKVVIKVMLSDGKYMEKRKTGRNQGYIKPYWEILQDYIWKQHYGEIPEGYHACTLTGNPEETNIENIVLIKDDAVPLMNRNGWWKIENRVILKTAIQCCNLRSIVKESERMIGAVNS